jgi:hypothetical protein
VWPLDGRIYREKRCRHTGLVAPARSKYVRQVRRRVARFSHYSQLFGNAVGIGNHHLYLLLELVSCFSSLSCAFLAMWRLRVFVPGGGLDGIGRILVSRPLATAVFVMFGVMAIAQGISLLGDCLCVSANVMPIEQVMFELLGNRGENPYDKGMRGNWEETLRPPFPLRQGLLAGRHTARSAALRKTV